MEKRIITGSVPYRSFKDKLRVMNDLKREFNNRVRMSDSDGAITYVHELHINDERSAFNCY